MSGPWKAGLHFPREASWAAATDLSAFFDSGEYGHAKRVVDLVLERLPSGEFA